MTATYAWPEILEASEKVDWDVADLLGPNDQFDFTRPFLPEALARVRGLAFLSPREQLRLNQIRAHGYLSTFGVVEEFILPFVLQHAGHAIVDAERTRALLGFAAEEAKHIHLFRRFAERFRAGFGQECGVIGPAEAVAKAVLAHDPLSVGLVILQIEWMTQRHWLEGVRDDQAIDERFRSLLKHHWMEEAQHAKADTLIVQQLAEGRSPKEIEAAIDGYLAIGKFIDDGLQTQVQLDLAALESDAGRRLGDAERERFVATQLQALRWTYLGSGMTNAKFLETLGELSPAGRARIESVSPAFC